MSQSNWGEFLFGSIVAILMAPFYLTAIILYSPIYILRTLSGLVASPSRKDEKIDSDKYRSKHHIPDNDKKWNDYGEYLNSETWRSKRSEVLERANGECEVSSCSREAKEVHHKRYPKNLGYEELGDLKAVCKKCHSEMHPEKPDRYTE